jgi:hypothetical protein
MLVLALAACTPGGQFDPTTLLQNDMFDSKKKLPGDREPVFPGGVPGTTTGVPPDLVKGYQPPPDQDASATDAAAQQAPPPEAKPKPKPKPRVAARTPQPPKQPATRISIGGKPKAPAQPAAAPSQNAGSTGQSESIWPSTPQNAPAQPQQQSQSIWPNPPATTSH